MCQTDIHHFGDCFCYHGFSGRVCSTLNVFVNSTTGTNISFSAHSNDGSVSYGPAIHSITVQSIKDALNRDLLGDFSGFCKRADVLYYSNRIDGLYNVTLFGCSDMFITAPLACNVHAGPSNGSSAATCTVAMRSIPTRVVPDIADGGGEEGTGGNGQRPRQENEAVEQPTAAPQQPTQPPGTPTPTATPTATPTRTQSPTATPTTSPCGTSTASTGMRTLSPTPTTTTTTTPTPTPTPTATNATFGLGDSSSGFIGWTVTAGGSDSSGSGSPFGFGTPPRSIMPPFSSTVNVSTAISHSPAGGVDNAIAKPAAAKPSTANQDANSTAMVDTESTMCATDWYTTALGQERLRLRGGGGTKRQLPVSVRYYIHVQANGVVTASYEGNVDVGTLANGLVRKVGLTGGVLYTAVGGVAGAVPIGHPALLLGIPVGPLTLLAAPYVYIYAMPPSTGASSAAPPPLPALSRVASSTGAPPAAPAPLQAPPRVAAPAAPLQPLAATAEDHSRPSKQAKVATFTIDAGMLAALAVPDTGSTYHTQYGTFERLIASITNFNSADKSTAAGEISNLYDDPGAHFQQVVIPGTTTTYNTYAYGPYMYGGAIHYTYAGDAVTGNTCPDTGQYIPSANGGAQGDQCGWNAMFHAYNAWQHPAGIINPVVPHGAVTFRGPEELRAYVFNALRGPMGLHTFRDIINHVLLDNVVDDYVRAVMDPTRDWIQRPFNVDDDADLNLYIHNYVLAGHMVQQDMIGFTGAVLGVNFDVLTAHMGHPVDRIIVAPGRPTLTIRYVGNHYVPMVPMAYANAVMGAVEAQQQHLHDLHEDYRAAELAGYEDPLSPALGLFLHRGGAPAPALPPLLPTSPFHAVALAQRADLGAHFGQDPANPDALKSMLSVYPRGNVPPGEAAQTLSHARQSLLPPTFAAFIEANAHWITAAQMAAIHAGGYWQQQTTTLGNRLIARELPLGGVGLWAGAGTNGHGITPTPGMIYADPAAPRVATPAQVTTPVTVVHAPFDDGILRVINDANVETPLTNLDVVLYATSLPAAPYVPVAIDRAVRALLQNTGVLLVVNPASAGHEAQHGMAAAHLAHLAAQGVGTLTATEEVVEGRLLAVLRFVRGAAAALPAAPLLAYGEAPPGGTTAREIPLFEAVAAGTAHNVLPPLYPSGALAHAGTGVCYTLTTRAAAAGVYGVAVEVPGGGAAAGVYYTGSSTDAFTRVVCEHTRARGRGAPAIAKALRKQGAVAHATVLWGVNEFPHALVHQMFGAGDLTVDQAAFLARLAEQRALEVVFRDLTPAQGRANVHPGAFGNGVAAYARENGLISARSEGFLDANHKLIPGSEGRTPAEAAALHNRLYPERTPLNAAGVTAALGFRISAAEGYLDANQVLIKGSEGLTPAEAAALHNRLYPERTPLNAAGVTAAQPRRAGIIAAASEGWQLRTGGAVIPGTEGLSLEDAVAHYNDNNVGAPITVADLKSVQTTRAGTIATATEGWMLRVGDGTVIAGTERMTVEEAVAHYNDNNVGAPITVADLKSVQTTRTGTIATATEGWMLRVGDGTVIAGTERMTVEEAVAHYNDNNVGAPITVASLKSVKNTRTGTIGVASEGWMLRVGDGTVIAGTERMTVEEAVAHYNDNNMGTAITTVDLKSVQTTRSGTIAAPALAALARERADGVFPLRRVCLCDPTGARLTGPAGMDRSMTVRKDSPSAGMISIPSSEATDLKRHKIIGPVAVGHQRAGKAVSLRTGSTADHYFVFGNFGETPAGAAVPAKPTGAQFFLARDADDVPAEPATDDDM